MRIARKKLVLLVVLSQLVGCATEEKKLTVRPVAPPTQQGNRQAVETALQLQGQPYTFGGESPAEGFDCSGLVYYVYGKQGLRLPRSTASLAQVLPAVPAEHRLPGDLLFFTIDAKPFSHVGIYIGADRFVHAPSSKTGRVMVSDLKQSYWQTHFTGVRRPVPSAGLSCNF